DLVSLDAGRHIEVRQFAHGAVDVDRLDDTGRGSAVALCAGHVDDERDARTSLEQRTRLRPLTLFAELIAMVRDKDNGGRFAQAEPFEFINNAAEVPVRPRDRGKIRADYLLRLRLRCAAPDEEVGVARANCALREARR